MPIPAGLGDGGPPRWAPGAQDIADVIPRRAVDTDGLGRGTFTASTVPTDLQAVRIGASFAVEVLSAVPDLPATLEEQATRVAAVGAAAQIELSFFPESGTDVSDKLQARYVAALASLTRTVEIVTGKDEPGAASGTGGDLVHSHAAGGFDSPVSDLDLILGRTVLFNDPLSSRWPYA